MNDSRSRTGLIGPGSGPYVRLSRIRLPPRVCDGEAIARPRMEDVRFRKPVVDLCPDSRMLASKDIEAELRSRWNAIILLVSDDLEQLCREVSWSTGTFAYFSKDTNCRD
jgi:hypothetical protein